MFFAIIFKRIQRKMGYPKLNVQVNVKSRSGSVDESAILEVMFEVEV